MSLQESERSEIEQLEQQQRNLRAALCLSTPSARYSEVFRDSH